MATNENESIFRGWAPPVRWLVMLAVVAAAPARADDLAAYARLQQWQYSTTPIEVPAEGLEWTTDTATWRLESGTVRLHEAVFEGVVTGLVFEGEGRFTIEVPDPFELAQLRRFAREPDLRKLERTFETLVLRAADLSFLEGLEMAPPEAVAPYPPAVERHDHWFERDALDVDAMVLAALVNQGARYERIAMQTASNEWLTWEYDSGRLEEISLEGWDRKEGFTESWLSLDRPEDRLPSGRPAYLPRPQFEVEHVDLEVRLTDGKSPAGFDYDHAGVFHAEMRFRPLLAGQRALQVHLTGGAGLTAVRAADGTTLPYVRDQLGERAKYRDDQAFDSTVTVFLESPLEAGAPQTLVFEYESDVGDYFAGRSWYPGPLHGGLGLADFHTATLTVAAKDMVDVRGMGERLGESRDGKWVTHAFRIDQPVKMMTFTCAKNTLEESHEIDGVPRVVVSGPYKNVSPDGLHDTGADLVNSIRFFQRLFRHDLPNEALQASLVTFAHGQAFDGFLHLTRGSHTEAYASTTLFRAHEVAHQWWGHIVGWKSYRDQWLSEAFAEYAAIEFVTAAVDGGDKVRYELLQRSNDELIGSLKSGFSRFDRPGRILLDDVALARVGPIGHGYRAGVAEAPGAYASMAYTKGPLVLHMLRGVLRGITKSDEVFFAVLRDFVAAYAGKAASTEDFKEVLARHLPADWDWFFDQWVYQAAIPTYEWSAALPGSKDAEGRWVTRLRVVQEDVPDGFRMLVPVRAEFGGGKSGEVWLMVDEADETFEIPMPARPRKVVFNPDYAVLSKTRKL